MDLKEDEWAMFVIAGLASAGAVLSGFLWNFILCVKGEVMAYIRSVKNWGEGEHDDLRGKDKTLAEAMQKRDDACAHHRIEIERRFALRKDVNDLRDHIDQTHAESVRLMNQRFDQITSLIVNNKG